MADFRKFAPYPLDPRYGVSRDGQMCRLTNVYHTPPGLIPQFENWNGYMRAMVRRKLRYVRILVAQTFIPNPENKPEVAHNDGDRKNNNCGNLRWATKAENQDDREQHGTVMFGDDHGRATLSNEDATKIQKILETKIPFRPPYHWQIAEEFGVSRSVVTNISIKRGWQRVIA